MLGDAARLEEEKTAVQTFATMTDEAILGDGLRRIQEKNILMKNNFPVQQAASLLTENSQVLQCMTPLATTNDHFLQCESELSGSSGILPKKTGEGISQLTAVFSPVQSSNVKFMTAASVITAREEGDEARAVGSGDAHRAGSTHRSFKTGEPFSSFTDRFL